jgi:hypothetical protein
VDNKRNDQHISANKKNNSQNISIMSQIDNTNTSANKQSAEQTIALQHYMLKRENSFPNWLVEKSMGFFFISLFACWLAWGYVPNYDLIFTAIVSIVLFFFVGRHMSNQFSLLGEKKFIRSVFTIGFVVRILWVFYLYYVFNPRYYGNNVGSMADVEWYVPFGKELSVWLSGNSLYSLSNIIDMYMAAIDDVAYPMLLGVEYLLTGGISDIFIPMLIKSILGAYCAICAYRIAKRHFGEGAARIAAIFVCLNPNMIYWCANMMKEAEMVFFCCLAVDKFDKVLYSNSQLTIKSLLPGILCGFVLLFMRTTLGLALFMAVLVHVLMASKKIISVGKKIFVGVLVAIVLTITVGDQLLNLSRGYLDNVKSGGQEQNMEWRSTRVGGNSFAKYATAGVFAPLIFTIPFPTFNAAHSGQLIQIQLSGGYFIKNILSFFVIIVLIQFLISGEWRKHVFIIGYTCAYLVVLVFSGYAQSGRFHMPIWPMLMIFAAYGIQQAKTDKKMRKWFMYALYFEIFICLVWNWFKLAGRGML